MAKKDWDGNGAVSGLLAELPAPAWASCRPSTFYLPAAAAKGALWVWRRLMKFQWERRRWCMRWVGWLCPSPRGTLTAWHQHRTVIRVFEISVVRKKVLNGGECLAQASHTQGCVTAEEPALTLTNNLKRSSCVSRLMLVRLQSFMLQPDRSISQYWFGFFPVRKWQLTETEPLKKMSPGDSGWLNQATAGWWGGQFRRNLTKIQILAFLDSKGFPLQVPWSRFFLFFYFLI